MPALQFPTGLGLPLPHWSFPFSGTFLLFLLCSPYTIPPILSILLIHWTTFALVSCGYQSHLRSLHSMRTVLETLLCDVQHLLHMPCYSAPSSHFLRPPYRPVYTAYPVLDSLL